MEALSQTFQPGRPLPGTRLVASPSLGEQDSIRQRSSKCSTAAQEPVQACVVGGSNRGSSQNENGREAPETVRGPNSGGGIRSSLSSPGTSFAPRSTYLSRSLSDRKSKERSSRNEGSIADAFLDKGKNPRPSDQQLKEDRGAWPKSVPHVPAVSVCSTRSSVAEEHGSRRGVGGDKKGGFVESWTGAGRREFYLNGNAVGSMEEPRGHWSSRLSPSTMGVVSTASTVSSGAEEPDFEVLKRGPSIRNRSVISPLKWTRGGREKSEELRFSHRTDTASGPERGRVTPQGITSDQSEDGPGESESGEEKVKKGLLGKVIVNFVRRDQKHQDVSSEPISPAGEIIVNSDPAPESPVSEGKKNARVDPPTIQGQRVFCLPPSAWAVETAADAYRKEIRIRAAVEREKQKNREDEDARAYVRSVVFNPDEETQRWREEVQDRLDTFRPENRPFSTFSTPVPAFSPPASDHEESPRGEYLCPQPQGPPVGRDPSNTPSSDREQRGSEPETEGDGIEETVRRLGDKKCSADAPGTQKKTRWRRAAARPSARFSHGSRTERSQSSRSPPPPCPVFRHRRQVHRSRAHPPDCELFQPTRSPTGQEGRNSANMERGAYLVGSPSDFKNLRDMVYQERCPPDQTAVLRGGPPATPSRALNSSVVAANSNQKEILQKKEEIESKIIRFASPSLRAAENRAVEPASSPSPFFTRSNQGGRMGDDVARKKPHSHFSFPSSTPGALQPPSPTSFRDVTEREKVRERGTCVSAPLKPTTYCGGLACPGRESEDTGGHGHASDKGALPSGLPSNNPGRRGTSGACMNAPGKCVFPSSSPSSGCHQASSSTSRRSEGSGRLHHTKRPLSPQPATVTGKSLFQAEEAGTGPQRLREDSPPPSPAAWTSRPRPILALQSCPSSPNHPSSSWGRSSNCKTPTGSGFPRIVSSRPRPAFTVGELDKPSAVDPFCASMYPSFSSESPDLSSPLRQSGAGGSSWTPGLPSRSGPFRSVAARVREDSLPGAMSVNYRCANDSHTPQSTSTRRKVTPGGILALSATYEYLRNDENKGNKQQKPLSVGTAIFGSGHPRPSSHLEQTNPRSLQAEASRLQMEREKLREQQAKAAQEYLRAAALEASAKEDRTRAKNYNLLYHKEQKKSAVLGARVESMLAELEKARNDLKAAQQSLNDQKARMKQAEKESSNQDRNSEPRPSSPSAPVDPTRHRLKYTRHLVGPSSGESAREESRSPKKKKTTKMARKPRVPSTPSSASEDDSSVSTASLRSRPAIPRRPSPRTSFASRSHERELSPRPVHYQDCTPAESERGRPGKSSFLAVPENSITQPLSPSAVERGRRPSSASSASPYVIPAGEETKRTDVLALIPVNGSTGVTDPRFAGGESPRSRELFPSREHPHSPREPVIGPRSLDHPALSSEEFADLLQTLTGVGELLKPLARAAGHKSEQPSPFLDVPGVLEKLRVSRHVHPALDNLYHELWRLYFSVLRDDSGSGQQTSYAADKSHLSERSEEIPRRPSTEARRRKSTKQSRDRKKQRTTRKDKERIGERGDSPLGRELREYYEQLWCRGYPHEDEGVEDALDPSDAVLTEERRRRKKEKRRVKKQEERSRHRGMQLGVESSSKSRDLTPKTAGEAAAAEDGERRRRRKGSRGYEDAPVISNPANLLFCAPPLTILREPDRAHWYDDEVSSTSDGSLDEGPLSSRSRGTSARTRPGSASATPTVTRRNAGRTSRGTPLTSSHGGRTSAGAAYTAGGAGVTPRGGPGYTSAGTARTYYSPRGDAHRDSPTRLGRSASPYSRRSSTSKRLSGASSDQPISSAKGSEEQERRAGLDVSPVPFYLKGRPASGESGHADRFQAALEKSKKRAKERKEAVAKSSSLGTSLTPSERTSGKGEGGRSRFSGSPSPRSVGRGSVCSDFDSLRYPAGRRSPRSGSPSQADGGSLAGLTDEGVRGRRSPVGALGGLSGAQVRGSDYPLGGPESQRGRRGSNIDSQSPRSLAVYSERRISTASSARGKDDRHAASSDFCLESRVSPRPLGDFDTFAARHAERSQRRYSGRRRDSEDEFSPRGSRRSSERQRRSSRRRSVLRTFSGDSDTSDTEGRRTGRTPSRYGSHLKMNMGGGEYYPRSSRRSPRPSPRRQSEWELLSAAIREREEAEKGAGGDADSRQGVRVKQKRYSVQGGSGGINGAPVKTMRSLGEAAKPGVASSPPKATTVTGPTSTLLNARKPSVVGGTVAGKASPTGAQTEIPPVKGKDAPSAGLLSPPMPEVKLSTDTSKKEGVPSGVSPLPAGGVATPFKPPQDKPTPGLSSSPGGPGKEGAAGLSVKATMPQESKAPGVTSKDSIKKEGGKAGTDPKGKEQPAKDPADASSKGEDAKAEGGELLKFKSKGDSAKTGGKEAPNKAKLETE
ncbi:neurofilament triplet protein, partial [Cystoisospora suis]